MTAPSLTPAQALAQLRELSLDVRSAVVLDAAGAPLAGDATLAEEARAALARGAGVVPHGADTLVLARAADGLAIAAVAGDRALLPLLQHDLATLLGDLAGA